MDNEVPDVYSDSVQFGVSPFTVVMAFGAAALGGCSQLAELPDIAKVPQRVLSKDEQQGKVQQMIAKG